MIQQKLYIMLFMGLNAFVPWMSVDMSHGLAFLLSVIGVIFMLFMVLCLGRSLDYHG